MRRIERKTRLHSSSNREKKKLRLFVRSQDLIKHEADYSWRPGKANPFVKHDALKKRIKYNLYLILGSFLLMFGLFFYHPFFRIDNFNIRGLQRINEVDLQSTLNGIIAYKKFFILPMNSYLIANEREIEDILRSRYPIENIVVKKEFPDTLNIVIEEKISTIIYDNGLEYGYLGLDGNLVEIIRKVGEDEWNIKTEISTTTLADGTIKSEEKEISREHIPPIKLVIQEMGDYPIVYDSRGHEAKLNEPALNQELVAGIINWFNLLTTRAGKQPAYFHVDDESGKAEIKMREGWWLKVDLITSLETQFTDLNYVLKEKVAGQSFNYIDLRFENRVYWR